MTAITREQSAKKAALLREFSNRQFTLSDLLQIFGQAFKSKFYERPTRHQMVGKHFGSTHGSARANPAGTKLLKKGFGKERVREALKRRAELVKEIIAVEDSEPNTGRMAHGVDRHNRAALLRIDRHGDVVAQYDALTDVRAYGWHHVALFNDFKLDKPTLVETITRIVRR